MPASKALTIYKNKHHHAGTCKWWVN